MIFLNSPLFLRFRDPPEFNYINFREQGQYSRTPLIRAAWDQVVSVNLKMPVTLKQVF